MVEQVEAERRCTMHSIKDSHRSIFAACSIQAIASPGKSWSLLFQFPGLESQSWNLSKGHEKLWESNVLSENRKAKRQKIKRNNRRVINRL